MHRSRAPSIAPGTFFVAQSWADCITSMAGFDSRQAQGVALVPGCMRSVQLPDVAYRPLADAREHSELAVAFRRAERAPAAKAFIEQMRGVAKRLKEPRLVEGSEERTKFCVTGIRNESLSGIESQGSGANGRSNQRMV